MLWKGVWKARHKEKREYERLLAEKAIQRDWAALKEIRTRPARQWQSSLLSHEDWKNEAVTHFEGIFVQQFPFPGKGGKALVQMGSLMKRCGESSQKERAGWTRWQTCTAVPYIKATCQTPQTRLLRSWPKRPQSWGETRPITLSCTALKTLAQLLLGRGREDPTDLLGMQWSERGKQTGELIFALRRISRMALD